MKSGLDDMPLFPPDDLLKMILKVLDSFFVKFILHTYFKNHRVTFYEQKARKNKKVLTWKKRDYDWLQKNAIAMLLWIQSKETSF